MYLCRDEILAHDATFIFFEFAFEVKDNLKCNKIIEILDKDDTSNVLKKFSTLTNYLYIPNLNMSQFIQNGKNDILIQIRLDKSRMDPNLCQNDSVVCKLRIISDVETPVSLVADTTKQQEFDKIIKSWQTTKNRSTEAQDARDKYFEKKESEPFVSKPNIKIVHPTTDNPRIYDSSDDQYFKNQLQELQQQIQQTEQHKQTYVFYCLLCFFFLSANWRLM